MTSRRPSPATTFAFGLSLFVALLALLAWQMRVGRDPSLDASRPALASTTSPRHQVVVRVIRRKVIKEKIVYIPPKGTTATASSPSYASAPATSSAPSVQTYSSAPVASAPAPVAAAPAPAPAPVQTHTS